MGRQNAPKYVRESRPPFDLRSSKTSVVKLLALGNEFGRRDVTLHCNNDPDLPWLFLLDD